MITVVESTTVWIGGSLDCVEEFHVANVVKVDLVLQYHHQTLSVQAHC